MLVTVGVDIAAGVLVVLVTMGTRVSWSGGGGLAVVLIGTGFSSLLVSSIAVVVVSVAVVDVVVVAGSVELRRVVVRTLLDWPALSIAVQRLPLVVVNINDLAPEGRVDGDMLGLI